MEPHPAQTSEMLVVEIEIISRRAICPESPFFQPCSLERSNSECAELRFLRAILHYYSLLCECGAKPVRFCCNQTQLQQSVGMNPQIALKVFHALRTIAAHSLGATNSDTGILATANSWFRQHTKHDIPITEAQWAECHRQIVILGNGLLMGIRDFLSSIELDPEMADMRENLRHTFAGLTRIEVETITADVLAEHNRSDLSPAWPFARSWKASFVSAKP